MEGSDLRKLLGLRSPEVRTYTVARIEAIRQAPAGKNTRLCKTQPAWMLNGTFYEAEQPHGYDLTSHTSHEVLLNMIDPCTPGVLTN